MKLSPEAILEINTIISKYDISHEQKIKFDDLIDGINFEGRDSGGLTPLLKELSVAEQDLEKIISLVS